MLFLSGLHGSSHIVIYKVFINFDNYTMGNLHFDDACCQVNALHFAIDATAGYNFLTFGQRVLKLLNLLALLLLRRILKKSLMAKIATIIMIKLMLPPWAPPACAARIICVIVVNIVFIV